MKSLLFKMCMVTCLAIIIPHLSTKGVFAAEPVSHEQIRDGLLTLVHSYSLLENKLDRHEQRERALGEVFKRNFQSLLKGQKMFDTLRGTFSRLDERISQMETVLLQQDEKYNDHQTKIGQALETILKWISSEKSHLNNDNDGNGDSDENTNLSKKVEDLSDNIKRLRQEIGEMAADKGTSDETSRQLLLQASADEVVTKLEEKLTHFYVTGPAAVIPSPVTTTTTPPPPPPSPAPRNTDWEDTVTKTLDELKTNVNEIKSSTTEVANAVAKAAVLASASSLSTSTNYNNFDRDFFVTMANETLEAIEDMRIEVLSASDKSFTKISTRIKEATTTLDGSINEALKTFTDTTVNSETLVERVSKSYSELKDDISNLSKMEKILLDTADNVISIKRGMEFNVHAVTLEIGELIKSNGQDINSTLNKRFNALNTTISENHNGALTNLTSKIETEISQVWRQIGIMYQEVSSSKDALNKLQEQTEAYVNGTITTMDSMQGKVILITGRMAEVDSNLNYLLGRLSLVTQEFNQIKTGLGSALDNIKSSFQIVQNKIQDVGPGPHKIQSEENETDFDLLPNNRDNQ